ncbi:MAG: DUF370 domain-containing protein [Actinomycetia bacterium]|nr:DUF370 domain-containing protein [Actinomycetes bacterium]
MYVHIGGDRMVEASSIIAILDADILAVSPVTRQMFSHLKGQGKVEDLDPTERKALILTEDRLWVSPIAPVTLARRARHAIPSE